jgi:hypothetical protein
MENAKFQFLFGGVGGGGLDPDDPDDRGVLLEQADVTPLSPAVSVVREVMATQIEDGDPPQVWAAAERLVAAGLDRDAVLAQRRGGASAVDVMELAYARAVDPNDDDSLADAVIDPLVADIVLCEGGWFERFLADRGPLLPDDEALLAATWVLVPRTVYEVVATRPGQGLTLLDLGTGERLEVRERTLSHEVEPGEILCGRAVPDGDTQQLIGGVFFVTPGTETHVLELCDDHRGEELCDYVAAQQRPPSL